MKYFISTFFFILTFFINGCDSSTFIADNNLSNFTLHGIVVDGYIQDAKVCIDKNGNTSCEDNENFTTTDQLGVFHLLTMNDVNQTPFLPIIACQGLDTSTQKTFQDQIKNIIDFSTFEENQTIIISPLTDLVSVSFLNRESNSSMALQEAKQTVAKVLNIKQSEIDKDPMQNIQLFAISQELQHSKFLIQTLFEKNMNHSLTTAQISKLQDDIKNEILNQNFDVEKILIAMEINQNITIPENEKIFTINQIHELKTTLNQLSEDTSLDIENLNRLQKSIDLKQSDAIKNLLNAKEGESIKIVALDITTESITQTEFDTKDAILDENACVASNGYHVIKNSGFMPDKTEDSDNGISLKSTYEYNTNEEFSEVELFYPDLNQTKEDENVVVFQDNSYYFAFDKAWTNNENKTIYIRTPKTDENGTYGCYKYVLNFRVSTDVKPTKVFRYNEIN